MKTPRKRGTKDMGDESIGDGLKDFTKAITFQEKLWTMRINSYNRIAL